MHVVIAGASGFIGTEVRRQLEEAGHRVTALVRRQSRGQDEARWDPSAGRIEQGVIDAADGVLNLSGASIGRLPWTHSYKREILHSRVSATRTLAEAIASSDRPPSVFVSGSAVGFYGNRPGEDLLDSAPKGEGFLSDVTDAWEKASRLAGPATRLVNARTGIVLGSGGALAPLAPLTRFGLGARIGSGRQHWPWISHRDEASALVHLLTASELSGPVNIVAPTPATARQITETLARVLHRPHLWVIPTPVVKALGDAGHDLMLADQKALPQKLSADGFRFRDTNLVTAFERNL